MNVHVVCTGECKCINQSITCIRISVYFQLSFFTYHIFTSGHAADPAGPVPIDSIFIYRPDKRQEVWRFLFYMVLHAG